MMLVETVGLSKTYEMGTYEVKAVDNLNLKIEEGDFISFMGPSGSGKTTLLNLIGCVDNPTRGKIYFEGKEVTSLKERELDTLRLLKIGFIFQSFNLLPTLSALENVSLPMELAGISGSKGKQRAKVLLELVGLEERFDHRPYQLSAGEQQRVGIARALANNPSLILADEPTGNLDSNTALDIANLLGKLNKEGRTVIVVTHAEDISQKAKKVFKMRDGKITPQGSLSS